MAGKDVKSGNGMGYTFWNIVGEKIEGIKDFLGGR